MTIYNTLEFITPGLHIGFATEFYTLWSAETPNGSQKVDYLGKISKSKETASEKYPGVPFTALQGESWNISSEREPKRSLEELNSLDHFWFGKYVDQKFSECTDINYLKWFFDNTQYGENKDFMNGSLISAIESAGLIFYKSSWYASQDEIDQMKGRDEILELIWMDDENNCGEMVIHLLSNINGNDYVRFHVPGYDEFNEFYEWGYEAKISSKLNDRITGQSSGKYSWRTLDGRYSMKKSEVLAKFHDGNIIGIRWEWGKKD